MKPPTPLHPLLLLLLLAAPATSSPSSSSSSSAASSSSSSSRPQKILLSDVQLLTLRGNNALTAHRRLPSVPQLRCTSPTPLCALHAIDIMRCTNQGSSYGAEDIEWTCAAEMPPELSLAATDVLCEGFRDPDDPYVLRGSCGVEYALSLTALGEQTYPDVVKAIRAAADAQDAEDAHASKGKQHKGPVFDDGRGREDLSAWLFVLIFLIVLAWIVYSAWIAGSWTPPASSSSSSQALTRSRRTLTARFDDDNNDIHDIDDDDNNNDDDHGDRHNPRGLRAPWTPGWPSRLPPPPYSDRRPDYTLSKRDRDRSDTLDRFYDTPRRHTAHDYDSPGHAYTRQRGWTPGFWSGFTSGGAAGYTVGRNSNSNSNTNPNTDEGYVVGRHSGTPVPRPRWDEPDYRAAWEAGPSVPRPSGAPGARAYGTRPDPVHSHSHSHSHGTSHAHSPSGGSGSVTTGRSDRYESKGYGSTRRR